HWAGISLGKHFIGQGFNRAGRARRGHPGEISCAVTSSISLGKVRPIRAYDPVEGQHSEGRR
ncbi:hypothetical protein ACFL6B_06415, partial [Thermodesulfobacteriota bacterium]